MAPFRRYSKMLNKTINVTIKQLQEMNTASEHSGELNPHSLSEQLAPLFPGKLIVERSRGLVLVGLVCRRRGGHT